MTKIIGNTTATPNPRPDWNQTDETKADYIKNKPIVLTEDDVVELIAENGGGSGGGSITIDTEFDINSDNAIANKTVTEFVNQTKEPKSVIELTNGVRLESIEDGIYFVHTVINGAGEEEEEPRQVFDNYNGMVMADESHYADLAQFDIDGNNIIETYATKEEVKSPKQVVEFSNGLKLESREGGVYLICKYPISETEEVTEEKLLFINEGIVYADESGYAVFAEYDVEGNNIIDTYATKEEVKSPKQVIEFANGIRLVAGTDGMYFAIDNPIDPTLEDASSVFFNSQHMVILADEAYTADVANSAISDNLGNNIYETYATKEEVGNINTALENIIAMQNSLIGGDSV